jgi:hypothetical protein
LVGASLWAAEQIKAQGKEFAFPKYCNQNLSNYKMSPAIFGKRLKELLPSIKKERMTKGNKREMFYFLPSLEDAKQQFVKANKLYGLVWSDQEELPLRQVS